VFFVCLLGIVQDQTKTQRCERERMQMRFRHIDSCETSGASVVQLILLHYLLTCLSFIINEKKAISKFCNTACYATEVLYSDHSETGKVHVIIILRQ
jgi:hypothetical protein